MDLFKNKKILIEQRPQYFVENVLKQIIYEKIFLLKQYVIYKKCQKHMWKQ